MLQGWQRASLSQHAVQKLEKFWMLKLSAVCQKHHSPPPTSSTQRECDRSRECCDGDTVITSQSCPHDRLGWGSIANACAKTTTNPPIVVPPTNPTQTNTGTMGGNEGHQGNMGGKERDNTKKPAKCKVRRATLFRPAPLPTPRHCSGVGSRASRVVFEQAL